MQLNDYSGNSTSYSLSFKKGGGNFGNENVSATSGSYYQNTAAMKDLTDTVGSFDFSSLSSFFRVPGGSVFTHTMNLDGLHSGDVVTFYMFISTGNGTYNGATLNAPTVTGGAGKFQYAATNGTGFSDTFSFANKKLTLVKWTGTVDNNSTALEFKIGGKYAGVAAAAFKVVPEPSTASLGLLALSGLLLRRRRSC